MNYNSSLYKCDLDNVARIQVPWDSLKDKCVLVTGATGLIGSFLVDVLMERNRQFCQNIKVICLCRNAGNAGQRFGGYLNEPLFEILEQDVCEPIASKADIDYIIHAASNANPIKYSTDPVGTMKANLIGTMNILEYSRLHDVKRVLFVSSGEVYGENRNDAESFNEDYCGYIDCNSPRACYPESKRAAEALCASYIKQYGMDTVIARPCHVYGPTMTGEDSRAIAQFLRNARDNEDIVLKSDGLMMRSLCYVADAVSGLIYTLLLGENGQAYNIANSGSNITIRHMAETIAKLFGLKITYSKPSDAEKAGFTKVTKAVLDAGKLQTLGWLPLVPPESGFERTVRMLRGQ
jgi:Nucleoside-diphosphate-sugar epimerases